MVLYIVGISLTACLAGIVQATSGFASGVVLMLVLPYLLSMVDAVSLTAILCGFCSFMTWWGVRKHVTLRNVLTPIPFYCIASFLAVRLSLGMDTTMLKRIFGVSLVIIATYFMFFDKRVKIRATLLSAGVCATLSGTIAGLFSVTGPPMAVYYLATCEDDKDKYLADSQLFFGLTYIFTITLRAFSGTMKLALLPMAAIGAVGLLAGAVLGRMIQKRINVQTMKQVIYVVLAASGVITIINSL